MCGLGLVGAFSRECGGLFCECAGQKSGDPGVEAGCVPVCGVVANWLGSKLSSASPNSEAVLEVEARLPAAARARPPGGRREDAAGAGVEERGGGGFHAFGKFAVNHGARIQNQIAKNGQGGAGAGGQTCAAR